MKNWYQKMSFRLKIECNIGLLYVRIFVQFMLDRIVFDFKKSAIAMEAVGWIIDQKLFCKMVIPYIPVHYTLHSMLKNVALFRPL